MNEFLSNIEGPLIDLIHAATDWLNRDLIEVDEDDEPAPPARFRINERGGIEAA